MFDQFYLQFYVLEIGVFTIQRTHSYFDCAFAECYLNLNKKLKGRL